MNPSYDDYLEARGLPPNTTPTPVGVQGVSMDYRIYAGLTPERRREDPNYDLFEQGRVNVYGTHREGNQTFARHGPSEWHHWYQTFYTLGENSFDRFSSASKFENILGQFGYLLGQNITMGDIDYDNQVWRVSRFVPPDEGGEDAGQLVDYACKVVHVRCFTHMTLPQAGYQILKEAQILLHTNHDSVMKVLKNIYIEDTESKFPFLFIASIMELMEGTVDGLVADSPQWVLPEFHCFWCLTDIGQGINYLHNEIRNPVGEWMRVVHMAIRTANILHKRYDADNRIRFKLADFEECIIYDRHFRPNIWNSEDPNELPPDVLPDPSQAPYGLSISAPEILYAQEDGADRTNLRLMPNDVFCLASSIGYARVDDQSTGEDRVNRMIEMLEDILNADEEPPDDSLNHLIMKAAHPNPEQRATIVEVLNHPYLQNPPP